jgi:hypothetical protein
MNWFICKDNSNLFKTAVLDKEGIIKFSYSLLV